MKFKCLKAVLTGSVLSISCLVNLANAGLIVDTVNDSFIDTTTGIEWMDFGINHVYTYNYVASQLGEGGIYDGWALATAAQAYTMWTNAFLGIGATIESPNYYGDGQFLAQDGEGIKGSVFVDLKDIMGYNHILNGGSSIEKYEAQGIFEGYNGKAKLTYGMYLTTNYDYHWHDSAEINDYGDPDDRGDNTTTRYSTMLVRENIVSVPEPNTLAVFALGVIGLGIRRFKKKQFSQFTV